MSALLVKLLARVGFFAVLAIILPLAVQNRQSVDIYLNPFSLLDTPEPALRLPLFLALLLALGIGLLLGYGLGRLTGHKAGRKSSHKTNHKKATDNAQKAADMMARMPQAGAAKNQPSRAQSMLQTGSKQAGGEKPSGAQAAREALAILKNGES